MVSNMTIEEELKSLMIQKSGSVNKFAQECGLPTSTVATIFTRGVDKTNVQTIIKICKHLGISADELAEGRITSSAYLTHLDEINTQLLNAQNYQRLLGYYKALIEEQMEKKEC